MGSRSFPTKQTIFPAFQRSNFVVNVNIYSTTCFHMISQKQSTLKHVKHSIRSILSMNLHPPHKHQPCKRGDQ